MIVAGSLRQLPYSLRVEGRQTYIVGYAFTPTGVEEPTVGNDWYPLDLDVYDNQEHASVDAYIASEEGQATLQGCGVSGLVPLETAVARLADNDINITVLDGLYRRMSIDGDYVMVDYRGRLVETAYGVPTVNTETSWVYNNPADFVQEHNNWGYVTLIMSTDEQPLTVTVGSQQYVTSGNTEYINSIDPNVTRIYPE